MRIYTANVKTPHLLNAMIDLSVLADGRPFDLTGATVALEIWDTRSDDQLLYSASEADPVITVADTVVVDIPADTSGYADLAVQYSYRYGLTIVHPALSFRVQGTWQKVVSYGPGQDTSTQWQISSTDASITIMTGGRGPAGEQGVPGEGYVGSYRQITTSDLIFPIDSTVEIVAGGSDITVALPDPAALFVDGTTRQGRVYRGVTDTGSVSITGSGADLFGGVLFPGESFMYESNGTALIIGG